MHPVRSSVLAVLLLATAGAVRGAGDTGGALDATKREIRQLQSDQKNKTGQDNDKLKLGVPTMELQPDASSPEAWLADKLKQEKKLKQRQQTNANSNWLIDGVEKLEKEDSSAKAMGHDAAKETTTTETAPHPIDQSDSQYLLKLFDEQKKSTDPKSTTGKSSVAAAPDPFAPFLEGWLGSSPVRGQFFDQSIRKPDAGTADMAPAASPGYRSAASTTLAPITTRDSAAADKPNPYLAELNAPILTKELAGEAAQLQSGGTPMLAPESAKTGPVAMPVDLAPPARERAKASLPGLTDDKKYFPQLKRF